MKLLSIVAFLTVQLMFTWYGYHTGNLSPKGSLFGWSYDSVFIRIVITQISFVWFLLLANMVFSLAFHWGFQGYKNFLAIATIWIGMGPIAAFIFNTFVTKEPVDIVTIVGLVLVGIGGVLVVAHKEIVAVLT